MKARPESTTPHPLDYSRQPVRRQAATAGVLLSCIPLLMAIASLWARYQQSMLMAFMFVYGLPFAAVVGLIGVILIVWRRRWTLLLLCLPAWIVGAGRSPFWLLGLRLIRR